MNTGLTHFDSLLAAALFVTVAAPGCAERAVPVRQTVVVAEPAARASTSRADAASSDDGRRVCQVVYQYPIVSADPAVPYGRVVHVFDVLRQAGIAKISFAVTSSK
jgi:hypothetical protein